MAAFADLADVLFVFDYQVTHLSAIPLSRVLLSPTARLFRFTGGFLCTMALFPLLLLILSRRQHKTEGIFTEHCVVIVEGTMVDGVFQVCRENIPAPALSFFAS